MTMAKKYKLSETTHTELNIEFANNGYILRNPYDIDDVDIIQTDETGNAIGKKITDRIGEMIKDSYFPVRCGTVKIVITLKEKS